MWHSLFSLFYLLPRPRGLRQRHVPFSLPPSSSSLVTATVTITVFLSQRIPMAPHPLQRLSSPSRSLSLLLHILGAASFSYNFHFLTAWETPLSEAYGWHFQFLTIIGLTASLLAFVFGILGDLTLIPALFEAKNAVAVLATPLEVVISILYWGIRFIDTSLLMPDDMGLGLLPDIGFHLAPAVFLTLDLIFFSPPWTIPVYTVMTLSTTLAFAYWYWVELCFSHNGW
jgi:hypothetical protein